MIKLSLQHTYIDSKTVDSGVKHNTLTNKMSLPCLAVLRFTFQSTFIKIHHELSIQLIPFKRRASMYFHHCNVFL